MSLTRIDYLLTQNIPTGGGSAGGGPIVSVSSLTQAGIVEAMTAAGAGGIVYFPPGNYPVSGLATIAENQTLILSPGATLFRTGGSHILTVSHVGTKIHGGTWDGNKQSGDPNFRAISANQNCGFELHDAVIKNIQGYGVGAVDGPFIVRGCRFSAVRYISIFFQSELTRSVSPIIIEDNVIVNNGSDYVDYGGIIIKTNNVVGNYLVKPVIRGNEVTLPIPADYTQASTVYPNSVCIELRGASAGIVEDNYVVGGVIGISLAKGNHPKMALNHAVNAFYYGLEVADTNAFALVMGNTSTGSNGLAGSSCGLSISANSDNTKVIGNIMYNNLNRIRITGDCDGTTEDFVARAAGYVG